MTTTSSATISQLPGTSFGEAFVHTLKLLWASTKAFFMGILLSTILQIIPILPTRKRTTGNILSRLFASFLFGPISLVLLLAFPLFLLPFWRSMVAKLSSSLVTWYEKEDLNPYGL